MRGVVKQRTRSGGGGGGGGEKEGEREDLTPSPVMTFGWPHDFSK